MPIDVRHVAVRDTVWQFGFHPLQDSLQSNRLAELGAGLAGLDQLEELYLSHNGLSSLAGVEALINLRILDVAANRIASFEGLASLARLTDFWANDNAVESLDAVEDSLKPLRETLTCVYLRGNPAAAHAQYKLRMRHLLPRLEQLDDSPLE